MEKIYTDPNKVPFKHNDIIGLGTVGVVEEVEGTDDIFLGHIYARKTIILSQNPSIRKQQLEEINREVAALKSVQHEHTVQLVTSYLLQTDPEKYAIVMDPRANGDNLEKFLTNSKNQDEPTRNQLLFLWLGCLMDAVTYIHERGIRHRDIKPTNILIHDSGVLISDFGISMMGLGITVPTTIIGRPRSRAPEYCSPDVEGGRTRGRSADVFSLGAVFLEMFAAQAGPKELDRLRGSLEVDDRQSYAKRLDKAFQFIDSFSSSTEDGSWESAILIICRKMLHKERDCRPKADEVRLWWSCQPHPAIPRACKCAPTTDELQLSSPDMMNNELRNAYRKGYQLIITMLVDKGAKISETDALVAACGGGHKHIAELLLENGANINGKDSEGRTGLHYAASSGGKEVVQMLVRRGANINIKDGNRETALQQAVRNNDREIILLLLESKGLRLRK